MGIPAPNSGGTTIAKGDQANFVLEGSFNAPSLQSPLAALYGVFNLFLFGTWTGSVQLERSFDGGVTWMICGLGGAGQQAIYADGTVVSAVFDEPERGMTYRLNCTALGSGTLNYRLSTTGAAARPWVPR